MRPAVERFGDRMSARLAEKDEEKGELGYRELSIADLDKELQRQLVMFHAALTGKREDMIIKRAVNAANYLMMIVDNLTVGDAEL